MANREFFHCLANEVRWLTAGKRKTKLKALTKGSGQRGLPA